MSDETERLEELLRRAEAAAEAARVHAGRALVAYANAEQAVERLRENLAATQEREDDR